MKKCSRCDKELYVDNFAKWGRGKDGLQPWCKDCQAKYRKEYLERRRLKYPEHNKKHKIYKKENRLKYTEYENKRRAKASKNVNYSAILERDGEVCYLCGEEVGEGELSFDHVVPLSRGGKHVEDNIKVTHLLCNQRKGDRLLPEK